MRYCIGSVFLLALCDTSLFNYFQFASAVNLKPLSTTTTTRTRSTPRSTEPQNSGTTKLYLYRRTAFDLLKFWSGESLNIRRHSNITNTSKEHKSHEIFNQGHARRKISRDGSAEVSGEKGGSTLAAGATDTHRHENLKLNGFTLKADMEKIMSRLDANVSITTIGTTIEHHDIVLCQITKKPAKYFRALEGEDKYVVEEPQKKIILIVHGLTSMGFRKVPCLYQSDSFLELVRMYTAHLDKFDIFLIPMANPDGTSDETLAIWNKNKSPQRSCPGVFVDRNFDVGWNKTDEINSCNQEYPGPRPFSEAESRAVADLIHHHNPKIIAYIHVHGGTYDAKTFMGDAVLYPKGYIDEADDDKYGDIETEIEDVVRVAGFRVYGVTVTSLFNWYGSGYTGSSVDYATTVYGIPFGMEFVMQPYADEEGDENDSEEISNTVLRHIWKNIIDTIFNHIYRTIENKGEDTK